MKINTFILLLALIIMAGSCKKDPDAPNGSNKILIGITTPDTVSYLFAKVSTQLNGTGGNQITQHGHCWSIESGPGIEDAHTSLGSIDGPGKVTSDISGLSDNKKYFIRAYFTFQGGTIYGIQKEIMTLKRGKPVAITGVTSEITISSVKISGSAPFDSGLVITQKGVCWDTIANPTLLKSIGHSEEGAGIGSFISLIAQLSDGKQYYFRAYATNERGTSYGDGKYFMTIQVVKPTVLTANITNITSITAISGGNVTSAGNGTVYARGVCWSTNPSPTTNNNHTTDGSGTGAYVSNLTGLTPNTLYYVRAYATNSFGTAYGNQVTFTTLAIVLPTITTTAVTAILYTTATSGGNVTSDGGATVTTRGVCWSISPTPTIANNYTSNGSGTGIFTSNLTGLIPNTLYYARAYAQNSVGTAYGNLVSFTTLAIVLPTITTTVVTDISYTTATSGGNVTSDGGATVTARGVCWSTSPTPTIANSHTSNGGGTGSFTSSITGLIPNTFYYVRAYATNIVGTAYGNQVSFTTAFPCGSSIIINHIAGAVSPVNKTVTYGTVNNIQGEPSKCWITSNLGADHQATAVDDATEASAGWYWQFNRKQGYKHTGTIRTPNTTWITSIIEDFDWQAANDPCTLELGSGWRIPSYTEWTNVDASGNWTNWNGPWNSALKMHAAGYLLSSGGSLSHRGSTGYYWSSTQTDAFDGGSLGFNSGSSSITTSYKADGFSARCVRDY